MTTALKKAVSRDTTFSCATEEYVPDASGKSIARGNS